MSVLSHYRTLWPGAQRTGQSAQHVSYAIKTTIPRAARSLSAGQFIQVVSKANIPWGWLGVLKGNNPGITWFVTSSEFRALMLYDLYNILAKGHVESLKPDALKNPYTGNRFHRLGSAGNLVVGVRWFILDKEVPDGMGMRARFQEASPEDENERTTTRASVEEAVKEVEKLPFLSLPEPPKERQRGGGRVPEQGQ